MLLSTVRISNYRSLDGCILDLSRLTPIVGYNNAGKTAALDAIAWLLEPSALQGTDFFDESQPVVIEGELIEIDDEDLIRLVEKHRTKIMPFVSTRQFKFRRRQEQPGGRKTDIDFELWDPKEKTWRPNPSGISQALNAFLPGTVPIQAMDDAAADVSKVKSTSTIGRLVAQVTEPIRSAHGEKVQEALDHVSRIFSTDGRDRAPELDELDNGASRRVGEFFPGLSISFHFPTPEFDELIGAGTLRVREDGIETPRELQSMGHGAQRSIQMALVRYLAETSATGGSDRPVLFLIDEPELYLHPQAVEATRAALKTLSRRSQIIFTTHSPRLVTVDEVGSALILGKGGDGRSLVRKRLSDAVHEALRDAPTQARTLLDLANASEVFFSDKVILTEGPHDTRVVAALFREFLATDPAQNRIGIVTLHGAGGVANALMVLRAMGVPASAVVDLDYVARDAVKAKLIDRDDERLELLRTLCDEKAAELGFETSGDRFPKNSNKGRAEDGFAKLASVGGAARCFDDLRAELRSHEIWCWPRGSMEHHVGLTQKCSEAVAELLIALQEKGQDAVKDPKAVKEMLRFLVSGT